jgi:E3 ubiquitin-protein ligase DOA10
MDINNKKKNKIIKKKRKKTKNNKIINPIVSLSKDVQLIRNNLIDVPFEEVLPEEIIVIEKSFIEMKNNEIEEIIIKECKICLSENNSHDLISPCICKGSLKYVHLSCLNCFHENTDKYKDKCSICGYIYKMENIQDNDTILNILSIYTLLYLNNVLSILASLNSNLFNFILLYIYICGTHVIVNKTRIHLYKIFSESNIHLITKYNYNYYCHLENHMISSILFVLVYKFIKYTILFNNDFYFVITYIIFSIVHIKKLYLEIKKNSIQTKIINF